MNFLVFLPLSTPLFWPEFSYFQSQFPKYFSLDCGKIGRFWLKVRRSFPKKCLNWNSRILKNKDADFFQWKIFHHFKRKLTPHRITGPTKLDMTFFEKSFFSILSITINAFYQTITMRWQYRFNFSFFIFAFKVLVLNLSVV